MAVTVQVAVDNATFHFDKLYTYNVPQEMQAQAHIGSMVLVPFGRRSEARMGVVLKINAAQEDVRARVIKPVFAITPETATLSDELLQLVYFLKERTYCTYYEAVRAIIPYGAQYKAVQVGGVPQLQKQIVRSTHKVYSLVQAPQKAPPKQQAVLDFLAEGEHARAEIEEAGLSLSSLDTLCKNGAVAMREEDKPLQLYENVPPQTEITLSGEQQAVYEQLAALLAGEKPETALLYGVTGSGKTLVFLRLLQQAVQVLHKTALLLVPEILLTPQMILRVKAYFGSRVAVQHSALNNTERLLQWQQIQNGEADIVVGTRSAVFAPLQNIGLIIMDEEQEHTYHSESDPRYDTHEIAALRAHENNALFLMASATPSTETYYAAKTGRIHLYQLKHRYNGLPLPQVRMVDMRDELFAGNTSAVSRELAGEIEHNLQNGEQSILLLNRRGYRTIGMCKKCRTVLKCPHCSVPLVYHKSDNRLMCHYCGTSVSPIPQVCSECGGEIRYTGFGTQHVEEELQQLFPAARILRMDTDSTGRKNAREAMLRQFAAGKYDIMLGTQMVAKGLDFERVSLVGVLGIDQMLFAQSYKAYENVFSLVTQVVGRGGRAELAGRAIIQTVDPQNPILALAAKQDYETFYQQEIAFRKVNLYPPFCSICMATFAAEKEETVFAAANAFAAALGTLAQQRPQMPLRLLGPVPMQVAMVKNKYRYILTIKCRNDKAFRSLLRDTLQAYAKDGWASKAAVNVDFHANADI